ncbi:hypothetical protein D3C75_1109850 [compost metagenome]
MALIPFTGQAFGGDIRYTVTADRLQQLEGIEADSLLQRRISVNLYIRMPPEGIQAGLLFSGQTIKTAIPRHVQHRGTPAEKLLLAVILGGMIRNIFAQ